MFGTRYDLDTYIVHDIQLRIMYSTFSEIFAVILYSFRDIKIFNTVTDT